MKGFLVSGHQRMAFLWFLKYEFSKYVWSWTEEGMRQEPRTGLNIRTLWSKTGGLALVSLHIRSYIYSSMNQVITYKGLNIVSLLCQSSASYTFH